MDASPFQRPLEIAALMQGFDRPWYVAGGWAIDLYLGRVRRRHKDVDLSMLRRDQLAIQAYLMQRGFTSMEKIVGEANERQPWPPGEELEPDTFQVFVELGSDGFAEFELLFGPTEGDEWLFRRNHQIRRPLSKLGMISEVGVPFLSPEIVLLFKSRHVHKPPADLDAKHVQFQSNDEADFQEVRETLNEEQRTWLKNAIELCYPGHRWLDQL